MPIEHQMLGLSPEKQSSRAILHALGRISESPEVAYHCGYGTQTYALLTEACATLSGFSIEEVQKNYPPAQPRDLEEGEMRPCPFCGGHYLNCDDEGRFDFAVHCEDCDVAGPSADTKEEAIEKWNERAAQRL